MALIDSFKKLNYKIWNSKSAKSTAQDYVAEIAKSTVYGFVAWFPFVSRGKMINHEDSLQENFINFVIWLLTCMV